MDLSTGLFATLFPQVQVKGRDMDREIQREGAERKIERKERGEMFKKFVTYCHLVGDDI